MQIFLDSANLKAIKKYASWGIIDGVTTNPSLIAKEGVDPKDRIMEITKVVDGPISVEVVAEEAETMIKQAEKVAAWHKNIYAKIPLTAEGLKAVKALTKKGIPTNVTLVFSVNQAVLAAKAGATLISPFVGRVDDISFDGMELVSNIVHVFDRYGFDTKVLAASIRHPRHVVDALGVGADIATIPPPLLDKMVTHPLTDKGLASFMKDWNACAACQNLYK